MNYPVKNINIPYREYNNNSISYKLTKNFTIGNSLLLHLDIDEQEIVELHKTIAENVKRIRKNKKVSQTDLALSIGHKSVSMVSKIEAGLENKHYNIEQLYKISKALNVDLAEFFK